MRADLLHDQFQDSGLHGFRVCFSTSQVKQLYMTDAAFTIYDVQYVCRSNTNCSDCAYMGGL